MAAQTYQWQPWNSSFSNFLQEYSLGSNHAVTEVIELNMAARLSFSNFLQQDSLGSKYAATAEAIELNMAAQTYLW